MLSLTLRFIWVLEGGLVTARPLFFRQYLTLAPCDGGMEDVAVNLALPCNPSTRKISRTQSLIDKTTRDDPTHTICTATLN